MIEIEDPPQVIGVCGKRGSGKDYLADFLCKRLGFSKISFAYHLKKICGIFEPSLDVFSEEAKSHKMTEFFIDPSMNTDLKKYIATSQPVKDITFVLKIDTQLFVCKFLNILQQLGCVSDAQFIRFPEGWTFGYFLQLVGTEVFRNNFGDSIWINMVRYRMKKIMCGKDEDIRMTNRFIISDVRFKNEADFVWELEGVVIRIKTLAEIQGTENPVAMVDGRSSQHASEVELERIVPDLVIKNEMNDDCLLLALKLAQTRFP